MKPNPRAQSSRIFAYLSLITALVLVPGCGGSSSGPGLSAYAGNYAGVINTPTSATTLAISINSLGYIVGSTVDPSTGTILTGTGSTDGSGSTSFSTTNAGTIVTYSGNLALNPTTHQLTGDLTDSTNTVNYVHLGSASTTNSTYVGTYSGAFTSSAGNGTIQFTVGSNGGLHGTIVSGSTETILGSIDASGNVYVAYLNPSGGADTIGLGTVQETGLNLTGSFTTYVGATAGPVVNFSVTQ